MMQFDRRRGVMYNIAIGFHYFRRDVFGYIFLGLLIPGLFLTFWMYVIYAPRYIHDPKSVFCCVHDGRDSVQRTPTGIRG